MAKKPWFKPRNVNNTIGYLLTEDKTAFSYKCFKEYFPDEETFNADKIAKNLKTFEKYGQAHISKYLLEEILKTHTFYVDYKSIISDKKFTSEWNDFETDFNENTEYCLNCMAVVMHHIILNQLLENDEPCSGTINLYRLNARILNHEPITCIKNLKVNCFGKLVSVRGIVIKASNLKLRCQCMAFRCSSCSEIQILRQVDGIYTCPGKCPTRGCRAQSNFTPLLSSSYTKTTSHQSLKLQELIVDENSDGGKVPRTIDCELSDDLVSSCKPGDDVTITGIMKILNNTEGSSSYNKNKQKSVFSMYLDATYVLNNTNQNQGDYGPTAQITFKTVDYHAIQKIHAEPFLFRFLVQSLCPNIYGHEIVKAALLLALFGGTKEVGRRSESHILMVGDPGLGKSQMLRACCNVAPRGVYVCSNVSTSSGLTATMTKEGRGEFALEAGALVLADQGCCCIDEFDKTPSQHACLLEAMEQQTISIAKAGILCNIPTATTVIAAANPVGGHYNKAKTVSENLKISSPMLTRFDLVFILLDQANEEVDGLLTEHVLLAHSSVKSTSSILRSGSTNSTQETGGVSLKQRLRMNHGEHIDHLPHQLFKKYIAYAQTYVHPKLSKDAQEHIKHFYCEVRRQFRNKSCSPLSLRLIRSLIRLTQARAKLELREVATEEDAVDVTDIMRNSLVDVFIDECGNLDTSRSQAGVGMSSRNQISKFLNILQQNAESQSKSIFSTKELELISDRVGNRDKFHSMLNTLNIQGFLLNKGKGNYQLVSVDF